jgi:hypothetical protein
MAAEALLVRVERLSLMADKAVTMPPKCLLA